MRSIPSMSSRGNSTPQSTTTILPRCSIAVMFLPISPSPPSGTILRRCRLGHATALQARSERRRSSARYRLGLGAGGRHERQAQAADLVPEQVHRHLDRDRAGGDEQRLEQRLQVLVDGRRAGLVAGAHEPRHLRHLRPHEVTGDTDAAPPVHAENVEQHVVVARVDANVAELAQPSRLGEVRVGLLDRDDVVDLRERRKRLGRQVHDAPARDVVHDDRQARAAATVRKCSMSPRSGGLL